jgi:hypothetical protein
MAEDAHPAKKARPSSQRTEIDHSFEGGSSPPHSLEWPQRQMRGGPQSLATPLQKGENSEDG